MYQTAAICLLGALASASAYVATPSALPRAGARRYASAMPPLRMALSFSAEDGPLSEESKGRPGEVKQPLFAAAFHNPWVTICCGDGSVGSGSGAGGASHSAERNPPRILAGGKPDNDQRA